MLTRHQFASALRRAVIVLAALLEVGLILYFARFFRAVADQNLDFVGIGPTRFDKIAPFLTRAGIVFVVVVALKSLAIGWAKAPLKLWIDAIVCAIASAVGVLMILTAHP